MDPRTKAMFAALEAQRNNFANENVNLRGELAMLATERETATKALNELKARFADQLTASKPEEQ